MTTQENSRNRALSADQLRFQFLTKEADLDSDEALHALVRRKGAWPEYRKLSRQELSNKVQAYLTRGLTEAEAHRATGLPLASADGTIKSKPVPAKDVPTLAWMPAKQAYDIPSPGRSRKGLLK